jgi:Cytochrome P460
MRAVAAALIVAVGIAGAVAVVAAAQPAANGLPKYTNGYTKWKKLNRKPIRGGSPAHSGVKNVYASKPKKGKRYPNGTVVLKTIAQPGKKGLPMQVAVMRKVRGVWRWVEYERRGKRYTPFAKGQVCTSCHVQAKANDWVFTKR